MRLLSRLVLTGLGSTIIFMLISIGNMKLDAQPERIIFKKFCNESLEFQAFRRLDCEYLI